jgi:hypothetical protein
LEVGIEREGFIHSIRHDLIHETVELLPLALPGIDSKKLKCRSSVDCGFLSEKQEKKN